MFASNGRLAAILVCAALTACAIGEGKRAKFDPDDVDWSKGQGANTIAGVAKLGAEGGKARTCASLPVRLAPDSSYTRQRISKLYGDRDEAFVDARRAQALRAKPDGAVDNRYERSLKASVCDKQGRFAFRNLPDGAYYVLAPVVWKNKLGEVAEGGFFMKRVTVRGGETKQVTLASR